MKAEHINPFITECQSMFQEVAGIPLKVAGTTLKQSPTSNKNVVIMLGVTGDLRGNVAINIDEEGVKYIASQMMGGMPVVELDEMTKSAISELGNMIMGRVCTAFSTKGTFIDITPPSLLTGDNIQLTFSQLPLLSITFKHENIEVEFDISIHAK
ncbi:chemotaxis protein CheX [Bacillus sp. M6-12]|uniref:chemotaxis protein CheX n=1 Tax=Bacillus sp. M6-12 TaxID=2054166 RepID=UPI000C78CAF3|nr:chemotaxis protein CheX [Bacillus sp. M6-12]PLS19094.1 chemotaxis protein CheX [Bacillus sp. M6-12]